MSPDQHPTPVGPAPRTRAPGPPARGWWVEARTTRAPLDGAQGPTRTWRRRRKRLRNRAVSHWPWARVGRDGDGDGATTRRYNGPGPAARCEAQIKRSMPLRFQPRLRLLPSAAAAAASAPPFPPHGPASATGSSVRLTGGRRRRRGAAVAMASGDARVAGIASSIRVIPDFPKPGIMFQDITTLLLDPKAFRDTIDLFVERYKDQGITVVAGVEARGFIFGPPIALAIGAKFVPLRKPKKLPGEVISEEYSLEYGTDKIEMHVGAVEANDRALVVDDLIATGGTLCAAVKLLERVGAKVVECACVIELPELKGRDKLGDRPVFVLVKADGA
ncbi:hypothetical protein PAHAL_3G480100 [Panicum hallii]|uniref:adenine phosphoribosyltransferase n=3 Tax=Magnoliopsida TaxID=3398 RepID=A0A2T8KLU2_9POAL|nr:hypothetical protein PAHAL_3G480100 [Panicum hallii]